MPEVRSMVRAFRSPTQSLVWYCAVKAKLSPATGCRFDVAAAAPAPTRVESASSVSERLCERVCGSRAEKNTPWPLTAACHRSSSAEGWSDDGGGQLVEPCEML